jgi:hypothetical protein
MKHRADRLRAEIDWHENLLKDLPAVVADETARTAHHKSRKDS